MKNDERFEQRWEFRRKEVDGDTSSDDNGSNSNRSHKLVTDLVLVENDDDLECQMGHDKVEETKNESNKKKKKTKQVLQKKPSANENKRKRNINNNETATLKDLKIFANSLIHELSVTRENMFAHMREEMRKLASSKSNLLPTKKNVRRSQKKKAETVADNEKHEPRRTNKQQKDDNLRPSAMVHMNHHRLVSSSNIPLQFQTQRNGVHLNDHIPQGVPKITNSSEIEIGKLMAAKRFSHRIAEFQPQECFNYQKSVGLVGQNSCIQGMGFPIPLIHGTSNGSNTSSLTYCENSFVDNGVRMNGSIARFPGWS
ncbi:hypothetical protein ACS0TY_004305 [Phlomoides rotata]